MHTDEYEISLSRELKVCLNTISKIKRLLASMEKKYAMETKDFVVRYFESGAAQDNKDFKVWLGGYQELKRWEERKTEYEKLFRSMKI